MSELNIEWTPEMGVKCEFTWGAGAEYYTCFYHGRTQNGAYIIELEDGQLKDSEHYQNIEFRPIKSAAERQIEAMIKIGVGDPYATEQNRTSTYVKTIKRLHDGGCRMTHKITADDIAELYRKHLVTIVAGSGYEFARSIENIILGEN